MNLQLKSMNRQYHATAQNPQSGEAYHESRSVDASFVVVIMGGNAWKVCATNLNDGQVGQIWCDGIDTYTSETVEEKFMLPDPAMVTVSRSEFYLGSYSGDYLDMSLPWLTYCVSPNTVAPNTNGVVALPLPWMNPRVSLGISIQMDDLCVRRRPIHSELVHAAR